MSNQQQNGNPSSPKDSSSEDSSTQDSSTEESSSLEMDEQYTEQDHQLETEPVAEEGTASADQPAEPEAESDAGIEGGRIEQLEAEVARLREQFLLTQAEMQNVRRRAQKDVENAHKFGLEKFVGELVNVADNLERAVDAINPDDEACKAVGEGVELTLKSFMGVLKRFNVEQIDPKGAPFNPEQHQAMTMVPNDELAPNTVIDVFQKGYLLSGRLVRPAMVVVSKKNSG